MDLMNTLLPKSRIAVVSTDSARMRAWANDPAAEPEFDDYSNEQKAMYRKQWVDQDAVAIQTLQGKMSQEVLEGMYQAQIDDLRGATYASANAGAELEFVEVA